MEINGLPAHALLVHLVVVLLPLTAVAAIVVSAWPAAQRKLTFLVPLGAVVGAIAVPITTRAGEDLAKKLGNPPFIERARELRRHGAPLGRRPRRDDARPVALPAPRRRDRAAARARGCWSIASAVGTATIVALTGDSGAQAVWGNS